MSMVDFFKKKDKVIPINNRSAVGTRLTSDGLLPQTESQDDKERRSKKIGRFAFQKAKQFGRVSIRGGKGVKRHVVESKIQKKERTKTIDKGIDNILDDESSSDSRKFRLLQRFGLENRNNLSKSQLRVINTSLAELDDRLSKRRLGQSAETGGMTNPRTVTTFQPSQSSIISQEDFDKLPEEVKAQIRQVTLT